jgi:endonuclease G
MEKKYSKNELEAAVRALADRYLTDPNITSVGIGTKISDDKDGKPVDTGELSFQFTVGQKIELESLAFDALGTTPIPSEVTAAGITLPTDIVERKFEVNPILVPAEELVKSPRKSRNDPMAPGMSIGHPKISAGTLGCLVRDRATQETLILSNWHVLMGSAGVLGDSIVQPGRADDDRTGANVAGTLLRSHLGLAGDCAVAKPSRAVTETIHDLGVAVREVADPELGDRVVKSGRTTDVTYGIVQRIHTIVKINYGAAGTHQIGCFEIRPDPSRPAKDHEISRGGDSGSAWIALGPGGKPTEVMVGLHFAGEAESEPDENDHALACYASSVFTKLELVPLPAPVEVPAVASGNTKGKRKPRRGSTPVVIATGYDPAFLGPGVAIPVLSGSDVAKVRSGGLVRHCTHFSVQMSKSRKLAHWVAWNIDGGRMRRLSRKGVPFLLDPEYAPADQFGDELYANNPLDRGHLARRADLLWGSEQEAKRANSDSFYFSNITPQLDNFNQSSRGPGLWGKLEDAVFEDMEVEDLKVSVMAGPVFAATDYPYKRPRVGTILIPRSYWKVLAWMEGGVLKAKAYVLTQNDLERKLEAFGLEEFKLYQVSLVALEGMIPLSFGELKQADDMRLSPESSGSGARLVVSRETI